MTVKGKSRMKLGVLSGATAAAVVLVAAALAFACTPQAEISLTPSVGPAGSTITVAGSGFSSRGGPVEVYWKSRSTAPVATAEPDLTGRVSLSFVVPPDTQGGYYTVVAIQNPAYPARAVFHVPGAAPAPEPAPRPEPAPQPEPAPLAEAAPQPGGTGQAPAPNAGQQPSAGRQRSGGREPGAGRRPSGRERPDSARGKPAAGRPQRPASPNAVVRDRSGRLVFGGSAAPAGDPPHGRRAAGAGAPRGAPGKALGAGEGPARGSASGDLWSGFASERNQSLTGGGSEATLPSSGSARTFAVGLGLLGLGLLALFSGFLIAAVRRRSRPRRA